MIKINKMFGIIDVNPTLQIISADWIEEYYDDQYLALLLRKNQVLISKETFDGNNYSAGLGDGSGYSSDYGFDVSGDCYSYGCGLGYGDGTGHGSGFIDGTGGYVGCGIIFGFLVGVLV